MTIIIINKINFVYICIYVNKTILYIQISFQNIYTQIKFSSLQKKKKKKIKFIKL
jgi:hypothetical protein